MNRPFNLEEAKAGQPLITRDGRPAKFVAWVPEEKRETHRVIFLLEGSIMGCGIMGRRDAQTPDDLFMASRKVVKWANIYRKGVNGVERVYALWPNEECAKAQRPAMSEEPFVAMARVEWEE